MLADAPFYARPEFWLYLAAWIPYTLFVLLYGFRSPWYASPIGRSLILSKLVISVLIGNALLTMIIGDYRGRTAVYAFVVGGAIVAGWYQLTNLVRLQHEDRLPPPGTCQPTEDAHL